MDGKYPTAPELPGKHTGRYEDVPEQGAPEPAEPAEPAASGKIQLIESTKPKQADEPDDEMLADDDEVVVAEDEDELNEHVAEPGDPDGVVANDRIKEWQQEHPLPVAEQKKRKPLWLKALVTLVVIAALAAGAWWFGNKKAEAPTTKTTNTQTQTHAPVTQTTVATKHYDSDTYTLGFDYPETWTVSDTAAKLTVTSPKLSLMGMSGPKQDGLAVVTIQNKQATIAGYPANGASAVLESDKLSYKKPTQVQRAQTYLSYLSFSGSGLDALYVTGDNGYQKDQTIPVADVVKGNPLISVTFVQCGTAGCSASGTALTLQASSWKSSQAAKDITNLLESLQLN